MQMFTTNGISMILIAIRLERSSALVMSPNEGMKKPMEMHIMMVPVSVVSWSWQLGIGLLKSTGSLVAIARTVRVAALS